MKVIKEGKDFKEIQGGLLALKVLMQKYELAIADPLPDQLEMDRKPLETIMSALFYA